jgi:signal transduction histidine kinase
MNPPDDRRDSSAVPPFLSGGGEMGERIRAHDWASTPLGPPAAWPQALRFALTICLHSTFPTAIYWGPDLRLLYNDAWAPIPAERHPWALGRPAREVWADIWDVIEPQFEQVLHTGGGLAFYDQYLPMERGGQPRETYWNYSFTPLLGEDGTIAGVFNQGNETTAQVLHERRREAETTRQRRLFQQAPGFITVLHGPEHAFEFVNDAYRRLFGERDYIGRPARDVFPDLAEQGIFDLLDKVFQTGERFVARRMPIRLATPDGRVETRYLDYIYEPVIDDDGNITGIFCEGVDATDMHRAEEALQEAKETLEQRVEQRTRELSEAHEALRHAQKMEAVGQLTGGIAHDFNNLLAAIGGSLEAIERKLAAGETGDLGRYIEGARSSTARAAALTQRLLAFSRRQALDPRPIDVNGLVTGLEEMIRRTVGPGIAVAVHPGAAPQVARVDAVQLENALLNLAINARDAMPDGGRLTLDVLGETLDDAEARQRDLPPGDYIKIRVTDTGTGIAGDVIDRIFDPFFTTKPLGQGTGLGLSMVHGFVRQSGGQVQVRSAPGEGTAICLLLPRFAGEPERAERPAPAPEPAGGTGRTVLVIDDEVIVRMLMVELLEDAGYRVIEAHDGPSALKALQQEGPIDVLVTDVGLPGGMNGRQVADAARETRPAIAVLFVTGYADMRAVGEDMAGGMQVMAKPFEGDELLRRVAELAERAPA